MNKKIINMDKSNIQEKVINILSVLLEKDNRSINESMSFYNDLGIDSLDKFMIAEEVEKTFSIKFSLNEIEELTAGTIKEMVDYIYTFLQGFEKTN